MRTEFAAWAETYAKDHSDFVFLSGDLGFMALESLRSYLGDRFINTGVSEQNMLSLAAGMAREGMSPLCYSIAPFAVFRPAEQTRIDVCLHRLNVKIVGNGGGYGYGIMGATHHALEDIAYLSSLQNMRCFIPAFREDVADVCKAMMEYSGPSYLRLNSGNKTDAFPAQPYRPIRQWAQGTQLTVIACGPILLNAQRALEAAKISADLFSISELPCLKLSELLRSSILQSKRVVFVEEHVARGGLAENISLLILQEGLSCHVRHHCALGYPDNLYGSQNFHQKISGLDSESLGASFRRFSEEP